MAMMLGLSVSTVGASLLEIDPTAAAYAEEVGLTDAQARRLSSFLRDINGAGVTPAAMFLGRSEWLARDGATWRAVVGSNATVTGTLTDGADGQEFPGDNNYARFANPAKSTALTGISLMAVAEAPTDSATRVFLSGHQVGNGPLLAPNFSRSQGTIPQETVGEFSDDGSGYFGWRSNSKVNNGGMLAATSSFRASDNVTVWGNASKGTITSAIPATIWNDDTLWGIGNEPVWAVALVGTVAFAMVSQTPIDTDAAWAPILSSGLLNGIFELEVDSVVVGVGDSLMEGLAGGVADEDTMLRALVWKTANDWQFLSSSRNAGVGGSGIADALSQYETVGRPWMRAIGFSGRVTLIWTGTNEPAYISNDADDRAEWVSGIMAIASAVSANSGVPCIISPLRMFTVAEPHVPRGNPEDESMDACVAALDAACSEAGVAFVDAHNDPDLYDHTVGFYVDHVHLTATGYQRVADLVAATINRDGSPV